MKKQLTKTRFNAVLGIASHLFGRAASLGAVILICHSATAQDLYVSARNGSSGKVLRFTWDGMQSIFAEELSDPQGLAMMRPLTASFSTGRSSTARRPSRNASSFRPRAASIKPSTHSAGP